MANGNNGDYDERVFENVCSLSLSLSYIALVFYKANIPKHRKRIFYEDEHFFPEHEKIGTIFGIAIICRLFDARNRRIA